MTRLAYLLDFGQLFKAFGNNKIAYVIREFILKKS